MTENEIRVSVALLDHLVGTLQNQITGLAAVQAAIASAQPTLSHSDPALEDVKTKLVAAAQTLVGKSEELLRRLP
jgi:uncharacterized membrane protein